jgi:hypothetical protein
MQLAATPAKRQRCVPVRGTSPPTSPPRSADADEAEAEAEAVRVRVRVRVGEGGRVRVEAEADSDVNETTVCAVCGSAEDEPGRDDVLLCDAVVVLEGRDCARTPSPRAEARPAASAKVARKAKCAPPKRIGRPYGSSNKVKGRREGQWHQGKYELQPGVSMVCLAAVDKETGHAQRGVHPSPCTRETGGGHTLSSHPSPRLTSRSVHAQRLHLSRPAMPALPRLTPPLILRSATRPGCGCVLPPDRIRWVLARGVAHVADGCPCAVIWTHGGGCPAGRDGLFRPAVLRPDWKGDASPDGNIHAWRGVQAHEEQPHVGQYAGYRLHGGQLAVGAASASESADACLRLSTPAATTPAT